MLVIKTLVTMNPLDASLCSLNSLIYLPLYLHPFTISPTYAPSFPACRNIDTLCRTCSPLVSAPWANVRSCFPPWQNAQRLAAGVQVAQTLTTPVVSVATPSLLAQAQALPFSAMPTAYNTGEVDEPQTLAFSCSACGTAD